jgi:hypothetical protein
MPGHATAPTTKHRGSPSIHRDGQRCTTGRTSNQALYLFFTSPLCPSPCDYKRERRATVTGVKPSKDRTPPQGTGTRHPLPTNLKPQLQALLPREHGSTILDIGYYSSEARTSINHIVSCANHPSPTHDRYKFTADGREP